MDLKYMMSWISVVVILGFSFYCLFKALIKYKRRIGKVGWVFSTFDLFKMNKEELFWFAMMFLILFLIIPVMIIFK